MRFLLVFLATCLLPSFSVTFLLPTRFAVTFVSYFVGIGSLQGAALLRQGETLTLRPSFAAAFATAFYLLLL